MRDADAWFEAAARVHADDVACRRGCDACCRGLFDISPLDAALVGEAVRALPAADRRALRDAARASLARIAAAAPGWGPPWRVGELGSEAFDALCEALDAEPCPALATDGACRIYAARPLVCRTHGLPMYDPGAERYCGGDCPLNLPPLRLAERPALHFDHAAFERDERQLLAHAAGPAAAAEPAEHATLVAAAIVAAAD